MSETQKKPAAKKKAVKQPEAKPMTAPWRGGREIKVKDGKAYEDVTIEEMDQRIAMTNGRINGLQKQVERFQGEKVKAEAELASLEAIKAQLS